MEKKRLLQRIIIYIIIVLAVFIVVVVVVWFPQSNSYDIRNFKITICVVKDELRLFVIYL